jgi:hypothetical protein
MRELLKETNSPRNREGRAANPFYRLLKRA